MYKIFYWLQALSFFLWVICAPASADELLPPKIEYREREENKILSARDIKLSLAGAVFFGLKQNSNIRSASLERMAQKFDLVVIARYFKPRISFNAEYIHVRQNGYVSTNRSAGPTLTLLTPFGAQITAGLAESGTNSDQDGMSRQNSVTLSAVYPLLRGAGHEVVRSPVRQAYINERISKLSQRGSAAQVISRIIVAYREVLRSRHEVVIASEALERSKQLLKINIALVDAGRMARLDIVQTEATIAEHELFLEESIFQKESSHLMLLQMLGLDLDTSLTLTDDLSVSLNEVSLVEMQQLALASRPEYLIQLARAELAEVQYSIAKNNRLLDVSLIAGAAQSRDNFGPSGLARSSKNWDAYAGIQLRIPFDEAESKRDEMRARTDVEIHDLARKEAQLQIEREVANSVRGIKSNWLRYKLAERSLELSKQKLEIERQRLQLGRSTNFQVLSFETDLRNAESAKLGSVIEYLNAQTQLSLIVGTTLDDWNIDLNE